MVLQKLFDGSRNAWSNARFESLVVDTTSAFTGDISTNGDLNIVGDAVIGTNLAVTGDAVIDGTLSVNGNDLTPVDATVQYEPDDPTRFVAAYAGAEVFFRKLGSRVYASVSFTNTNNTATQGGPNPIIFNPSTPLPAGFAPLNTHVYSIPVRIDDGTGSFQYFAQGSLAFDPTGVLTFRLLRDDAGTLKIDQFADGLVFRTENFGVNYIS